MRQKHLNRNIHDDVERRKASTGRQGGFQEKILCTDKRQGRGAGSAAEGNHTEEIEVVKVPELEGEFGFVTPVMMEGDYETRSKLYKEQIVHMIRIQD